MISTANPSTPQWSSRLSFILAAIGSSVGLGNLWRFSAEAGSNGGGAFIVVYLLCVAIIGIPAIMGELLIGRAGQASSPINSARDLTRRSKRPVFWNSGVWLGVINGFLIVTFYCVVAAWVLAYIPKFLTGAFNGQAPLEIAAQFDQLIVSPGHLMIWFLVFAGLTTGLVARGVNRGLEVTSKFLMPAFFFLLLGLCIYSLFSSIASGGTQQALQFMFSPDFSKINGEVAVSAMGQAFFSLGVGMSIMVAYGSYVPRDVSIPKSAVIIGICDTSVALIAGMAVFPIVFQHGLDFQAGAGLFFQTLPTALIATPGGNLIGAAFFCMAFFAALTTAVALLEPAVAHIAEEFKMEKFRAALIGGAIMTLIGLGSLYSLEFLDFLDQGLTAPITLPLSALIIVIFLGWRIERKLLEHEFTEADAKLGRGLLFIMKYIAPLLITSILLAGIHDRYLS